MLTKYEPIHAPNREEVRGKLFPQIQASLVGALTNLGIGVVIGYPGVTFPDLTQQNNNDLTLNQMEVELFGSLAYIGSVFGCFLSGVFMVWYGQRKTLLFALPIAMIGWIILGIGSSIWMIQLARLLLGVYVGFGYTTAGNFVIEIAHHSIRGRLSGLVNVSRQLGFLFVYAVGSTEITWRQLAFLSGGISLVIPFIGLLYLPDSPRWLASVHRYDEARQSLAQLRGDIYDVDSELKSFLYQNDRQEGLLKHQFKELKKPFVLSRFLLLNFIYILFSMSGNSSIVTYTAILFKEAHNYLNKYQSTIITGVVRTIGSIIFLLIGDKYERKTLMKIPIFIMFICMLSLGVYFYLKSESEHEISCIKWIPLTSVVAHQFFVCLTPISFLPGELLPTSARSMGTSIIWMMSFVSAFIMVFTYPIMEQSIGLYGTFWFYAADCLLFVFVIYFLPESKGLSLEVVNNEDKTLSTDITLTEAGYGSISNAALYF